MTADERLDLTAAAAEARQFSATFRQVLTEELVLPAKRVEQALVALLAGGHLLLEGNPGTGKRTLGATLARLAGLSFSPVCCTPDMEPADLTGSEQLREDPETGKRTYQHVPGPLFANVSYAENIHLAPPRSLAVLIDSARRRQVGHGHKLKDLPSPFLLVASIAPDLEDTEMALEAGVTDRFLLNLSFDYPGETAEWEIGRRARQPSGQATAPLISPEQLTALQRAASAVELSDEVLGYAWALARATRPGNELAPEFVETWIRLGISPQGLIALVSSAKARALMRGRTSATRRDVYELAPVVFQHRLLGNEEAKAAGLGVDRLISMLLERISIDADYRPEHPLPKGEES